MTSKNLQNSTVKVGSRRKRVIRAAMAGACLSVLAACSSPEQKVEKFTKSGLEFLESAEYGKANVQFRNALKIDEAHVPALMGVAKVAENRQEYKQMFGALQRAVRNDPNNIEAHVLLGKLFLVGSDETQALEHAEKAIVLAPDSADAIALKAAVLIKLEDEAQAVELAKRAIELDPGNPEAVTVLATERARAKDYQGAIDYLDGALAANSKQAVLHLLRLQMLKNLGRDAEVDEGHRKLIAEFPDEAGYRRIYVGKLIQDKRLPEAREQLVEVAKMMYKRVDPVLDVVRIDYRLGGNEAAAKTFQAYLDERPDDVELKFAYASFLRQQSDFDGAQKIYDEISKLADEPEMELRAKNEIAAQRLLEGKKDDANSIITEILEKDERNTAALLKRAGLKIDAGENDDAIRDLRIVLDDEPQSAPARMLMATAFERKGDVALAQSQMAQAVEDSDFASKQANIFAKFLIRNNEQTRAENVLVESLAKNPGDLDNLKFLAAIRLLKQDWRGAEEVAKIIDNVNDEDPVVNRILGAAYTGLQDYSGAIGALEAENDRAPLAARPLTTLVAAYMQSDRAADAEELLRGIIEKNPDNYAGRMLLARVLVAQKKNDDARGVLMSAIEKNPEEFQGYEALYRLHILDGRTDEANALVERGLQVSPDNDGLKVIKADRLLSDGKEEEAMVIYEDILTRRPDDRLVANNYVSLLTKLRSDAQSRQKAVDIAEVLVGVENAFFQDTLGWALVLNGDLESGVEALSMAVKAMPGLAEARYHYGAALIQSGEIDAGRLELREAIKLAPASEGFVVEAQKLLNQ